MRQGVGRKDTFQEDTFNLAANAEPLLDAAPPVRLLPKCLFILSQAKSWPIRAREWQSHLAGARGMRWRLFNGGEGRNVVRVTDLWPGCLFCWFSMNFLPHLHHIPYIQSWNFRSNVANTKRSKEGSWWLNHPAVMQSPQPCVPSTGWNIWKWRFPWGTITPHLSASLVGSLGWTRRERSGMQSIFLVAADSLGWTGRERKDTKSISPFIALHETPPQNLHPALST